MKVGSLFAGIGGFDLAAERAGMTVVWQSEVDDHASRVLAHHWPEVPNYGDIHNIRVEAGVPSGERSGRSGGSGGGVHADRRGKPEVGQATDHLPDGGTDDLGQPANVDVLCGGFPCQDYSVAGTRDGLAGDRGALWWEYHRLITDLRPTWVVGENVPGLLSSRGGRDFETIVGSLTELGYGVAWAVLDAQYFGVAQRRRRVFIVGHSGGVPRPEVLALGEGLFGHPEPSRETGTKPPTALTRSFGKGGGDLAHAEAGWLVFDAQRRGDGVRIQGDTTPTLSAMMGTGGLNTPMVAFAQNQRDEVRDLDDKAGALNAEPGMKQQTFVLQGAGRTSLGLPSAPAVARTLTQGAPSAGRRNEDDYNLVAFSAGNAERWGTAKNETLLADPPQVRRLTPLERERLQGFPDGWTDIPGNSDTQRYRQLGNAVAVPVVEWLMRRIVEAD